MKGLLHNQELCWLTGHTATVAETSDYRNGRLLTGSSATRKLSAAASSPLANCTQTKLRSSRTDALPGGETGNPRAAAARPAGDWSPDRRQHASPWGHSRKHGWRGAGCSRAGP